MKNSLFVIISPQKTRIQTSSSSFSLSEKGSFHLFFDLLFFSLTQVFFSSWLYILSSSHSKGSILTSLDSIAAESIGERSAWRLNGHCLPDFRREGVVKEKAACVECTRDCKPMLSAEELVYAA